MSKRKKHTFTLSEAAKKKLVLNLPYCMIGLYATKLGQAWRMAEGTNLSEKLLHLGDGFASAFASSLPSFHPADLLVGLLAGLLLRLAVYLKSKDAKKFRKGREYGSARWGTRKDIEPFIDPVFKNNILLTQTERLTMNSRPKDPRTARNKNVLVIGGSGSGKTRYLLKPNLMQCHSSYVITDPKGSLLIECGHLLEKKKYQIRFFNTINFKKSLHYNPFHYIHSEKDILKLANVLITNTDGGQKSGDPFWRNAEMLLYPEQLRQQEDYIAGFKADMQTLSDHPVPQEDFVGIELLGKAYADKSAAGETLLALCKIAPHDHDTAIGHYRGLSVTLSYDSFNAQFQLLLRGEMTHIVNLGADARGNLLRIENALNNIPVRMQKAQEQVDSLHQQIEAAKLEITQPFPQELELTTKSARLAELDALLSMDKSAPMNNKSEKPSVLASLERSSSGMQKDTPQRRSDRPLDAAL